jgi:hypothetical protein
VSKPNARGLGAFHSPFCQESLQEGGDDRRLATFFEQERIVAVAGLDFVVLDAFAVRSQCGLQFI